MRSEIQPSAATVSDSIQVTLAYESPETTHYSVVDRTGLAVSVTYTLEYGYGSRITVPGAGFLLNNEMGDFNAQPGLTTSRGLIGTDANLARPEKRMLSSMTPSIIARDGELVAVIGSPGGRTIINTVMQVFLNIADFGMNIQEAVSAKRFHHQWLPDRIRMEDEALSEVGLEALRAMGHEVSMGGRQGSANSIGIDPETGRPPGSSGPTQSGCRRVRTLATQEGRRDPGRGVTRGLLPCDLGKGSLRAEIGRDRLIARSTAAEDSAGRLPR